MSNNNQGMIERLARVERKNRQLGKGLGIALIVLCSLAFMAMSDAQTEKVLKVKGIAIVDEAGETVAYFGVDKEGVTSLSFLEKDGFRQELSNRGIGIYSENHTIGIGFSDAGFGIGVYDKNNVGRVALGGSLTREVYGVAVSDKNDKRRVALGQGSDEVFGFSVMDAEGKPHYSVPENFDLSKK